MSETNMPFIPAWAESALEKPTPFDKAELQALREFHEVWQAYHLIPNDKLHKRQQQQAAEALIVRHEEIRNLNRKTGVLKLKAH